MKPARPFSLSILVIFIWLSKLLFMGGVLYSMSYISTRKDFYLGIGLRDTSWQFYLLLAGSTIVLLSSFGLYLLNKKAMTFYFLGKVIELISLLWIIPVFVSGLSTALKGLNEPIFLLFSLIALVCLWLLFPLILITYKTYFR